MELIIASAIAVAIAIIAAIAAIKLSARKIVSAGIAYPRTPEPVASVEKDADGLYPEPPAGPEVFYGTLDRAARSAIDKNRTQLDRARRVWAETHVPERAIIIAEDGSTLAGYIYRSETPSKRWALCVHGYRGSHDEMEAVAMHYCEHGYNALAIDLRHHGESEGDTVGLGWLDRRDAVLWCRMLVERFGDGIAIIMHGWSMGAATVMLASSESDLPEQVIACIEDCGFASFRTLVDMATASLPRPVANVIVANAKPIISSSHGIDITAPLVRERIARTKIPVFFLHGDHDPIIPPAALAELSSACSAAGSQTWLVKDAGHCQAVISDTDEYFKRVLAFADSAMEAAGR